MTLYESLQDKGKGRFIDTGCDYEMIALAKGTYTFTLASGATNSIILSGTQGENARKMEKDFYRWTNGIYHNTITKLEYSRKY